MRPRAQYGVGPAVTVRLRSRRSGEDLRNLGPIIQDGIKSKRARSKRSDNSPRVALSRVVTALSKDKSSPDVLCGWNPLYAVLLAATEWVDHADDKAKEYGENRKTRKLRASIRAVAGWMMNAKEIDDDHKELDEVF